MMLEVVREDYIRTAYSKGLTERAVVFRHAVKNALIPVITVIGLNIPVVIGGSVIIEQLFGLPGMGPAGHRSGVPPRLPGDNRGNARIQYVRAGHHSDN